MGDALTEEFSDWPLMSEILNLGASTVSSQWEDHMKRHVLRESRFDAAESRPLCMNGGTSRGNRESDSMPRSDHSLSGRSDKSEAILSTGTLPSGQTIS